VDTQPGCEQIQEWLVAGELPPGLRDHVEACGECRFVAELSQRFGQDAGRSRSAGPLGGALEGILESAVGGGEPFLGRYRLESQAGSGGQGRVFRAIDLETDDVVAIKLVRVREPEAKALEVAHARRVRHPNVCRVFHAERHGELRIIVMEYL